MIEIRITAENLSDAIKQMSVIKVADAIEQAKAEEPKEVVAEEKPKKKAAKKSAKAEEKAEPQVEATTPTPVEQPEVKETVTEAVTNVPEPIVPQPTHAVEPEVVAPQPVVEEAPKTADMPTLDAIGAAAAKFGTANGFPGLQQLSGVMQKVGIVALTDAKPEMIPTLVTELRAIGVEI